jgi:hypothetical protein
MPSAMPVDAPVPLGKLKRIDVIVGTPPDVQPGVVVVNNVKVAYLYINGKTESLPPAELPDEDVPITIVVNDLPVAKMSMTGIVIPIGGGNIINPERIES